MRILSKTWKQAWLTLSNLEFRVEYMSRGSVIVDTIMERYRDDKIPIDKFEFSNYSGSNDNDLFFIRINTWLDMALQNGVKDIIYENPYYLTRSYPFPIINVLAGKCFKRIGFERLYMAKHLAVARYTKTTKRLAERSVMGPTYCRGKSKGAGVYKMGLSATVYHVWAGKEPKGVSEVHKTNNSHCKGDDSRSHSKNKSTLGD
ncbi:hypothetical protein FXO38_14030 [Capsicum annuum]|uniref:Uncharacterized protein n=1 Tax=Capsicum annuum TaxID=4072 RepID=A0A2G2Y9M6_CAPAN|nr:hypothetical protein FXO38_14030 [Capsicum annuum]PHT66465.1 hypothetical protein T459_30890 [Capsicum annuum]